MHINYDYNSYILMKYPITFCLQWQLPFLYLFSISRIIVCTALRCICAPKSKFNFLLKILNPAFKCFFLFHPHHLALNKEVHPTLFKNQHSQPTFMSYHCQERSHSKRGPLFSQFTPSLFPSLSYTVLKATYFLSPFPCPVYGELEPITSFI